LLTNNQLSWSRLLKLDWQPTRSMFYVLDVRYSSEKSSFYQFLHGIYFEKINYNSNCSINM
jgi:hypothetical protein